MEEKSVAPALSDAQKLRVVLAHRDYIKADAARNAATVALTSVVDVIGVELGVEKGRYSINIDTLALVEVPKP